MGKGTRNRQRREVATVEAKKAYRQKDVDKIIKAEVEQYCKVMIKEERQAISEAVLVVLHDECGFDVPRLKQFYDRFDQYHQELIDKYELGGIDEWLCHRMLLEIGIDLDTNTWGEVKDGEVPTDTTG